MAGCFCLSSISDFGDSSCHGSETAETFIHQLFALVSIQFLYGLHDWCLFFLIFYCPSIDKLVRIQKSIVPYGITSLLAGGASMIIVLPAVLDLRSNGEALSQITTLKTEATSYLDLIMKNMIGVYDTTKYGSIPFIYAGLLPLVHCLFYFASRKVPLKISFCTVVFSPYLSQVFILFH